MAMQHEWGVARPVGGMGAFVDTLVAIGTRHGMTYITGEGVSHIIIENGRANGVTLASGRQVLAVNIIGALDPVTLMTKLLPSSASPAQLRGELNGLTVFPSNIDPACVDILAQSKPQMVVSADQAADILSNSVLSAPATIEATGAFIKACSEGRLEDTY